MDDTARKRIETQLAEMELLMSMYTNKGELEFDDPSEITDLRAALNSDSATVHVGGVGFTLHLAVMQVLLDIRMSVHSDCKSDCALQDNSPTQCYALQCHTHRIHRLTVTFRMKLR